VEKFATSQSIWRNRHAYDNPHETLAFVARPHHHPGGAHTDLVGARSPCLALNRTWDISLATNLVIYYAMIVLTTLVVLKVLRQAFPWKNGFRELSHRNTYPYMLYMAVHQVNLSPLRKMVPSILAKHYYRYLGTRFESDGQIVGGHLCDPQLVTIGADAVIGDESLLLCHGITVAPSGEDFLVVSPITVKARAIVGAHSVVMPGVTIGENSVIAAGSVVSFGSPSRITRSGGVRRHANSVIFDARLEYRTFLCACARPL